MNTWDTIVKLFLLAGLSFSQDIIGVIEYPPDPEERLLCGERCLNEQPPSAAFSCEQLASELGACDSSLVYGYCLCSCQKCPREGWYYINQNQSLSPSINTTLSTAAFESNFFDTQAIGLSVGGALDTESFRRSIDNNIVPLRSDITYEGVFNEYFFNISDDRQCNELVCAKYSAAVSKDPILNSTQMFLAVGFESGIQMDNFSRPDLNLVILLDTSLSMKYSFEREDEEEENGGSMRKIDVAKQAIQGMLGHLTPKDNFAVISFSHNSRTLVDFASGTKENIESANVKINRTWPFGGTNLEAALNASLEIIPQEEQSVRQNRLIVVTDANLNAGEISIDGLGDIIQQYSLRKNPIYTTIIGVGLDFNSTLVRRIQQNRGANYFTVSSPEQFVKKLDKEFEYIVTPLVFDLRLEFEDFSLYGKVKYQQHNLSHLSFAFIGLAGLYLALLIFPVGVLSLQSGVWSGSQRLKQLFFNNKLTQQTQS
eukprot:TRINITY_DN1422_c0_g1_i3.p1 TRINITY_DN1422_c0_g1~~TRINITY_DN1422_c0_g1_i3.p1  ORF type:complete len:484 (-),score=31.75 TRINITY_DN1422_c0_g1_i3:1079-2530(-)